MKEYVYILTNKDRNNLQLHVGMCKNIAKAMKFYRDIPCLHADPQKALIHLVYLEEYEAAADKANKRFMELSAFTHMQKRELIKSVNPQWVDMTEQAINEV